jgi:cytochrome c-type biogenesis protein CcmE
MLRPDGEIAASEVLAKHDETYMPPEVADALKKAGQWAPAPKPTVDFRPATPIPAKPG